MPIAAVLSIVTVFSIAYVSARCSVPPEGPRPLRIMPLGDSITRGKDDIGYRLSLSQALKNAKIKYTFVGRLAHGSGGGVDLAHEGHNGAVIDDLIGMTDELMTKFEPDVVLLMIGANDVEARLDLDGMPARYRTLVERIVAVRPRTRLFVSEIALIRPPEFNALAHAFNPKIKALVEAMASSGKRVTFVPMHDVLALDDLDAVDHPDARGNVKIAARWFDYLAKAFRGYSAED